MQFTNKPTRLLAASLLLLTTILVGACGNDDPATPQQTNTITDIVNTNSNFTILRAAVVKAGLADALRSGTLTVFAPTDQAFREAGIQNVDNLTAAQLTPILQYHVLSTRVPAANLQTANSVPTQTLLTGANGVAYVTKTSSGSVSVNGKRVTTADIAADNGVVHIIDGVLMPPSTNAVALLVSDPANYSLLTTAVTRAGLATGLASTTGVTILAPNNAAFAAENITLATINTLTPAQLTRILQYHIIPAIAFSTNVPSGPVPTSLTGATLTGAVSGTSVTFTGAGNGGRVSTVTSANNLTTGGVVVHVINRILLPPP